MATYSNYLQLRKAVAPPPDPHLDSTRYYADTDGVLRAKQSNGDDAPVGGGGGSISVTDGSTTVDPATSIDFSSGGTVTDGGGGVAQVAVGGSMPVTAVYQGNAVTIPDGTSAQLTWDTLLYGDTDLLDRSTPDIPTVLEDGVYEIAVNAGLNASPGELTAGGSAAAFFEFSNNPAGMTATMPGGVLATQSLLAVQVTGTVELDAGEGIYLTVANDDGAASRDFKILYATVTKIG